MEINGAVSGKPVKWSEAIAEALQPKDLEVVRWASSAVNPRNLREIQLYDVTLASDGIVVGRAPRVDLSVRGLAASFKEKLCEASRFKSALALSGEYSKESPYDKRSICEEVTPSHIERHRAKEPC